MDMRYGSLGYPAFVIAITLLFWGERFLAIFADLASPDVTLLLAQSDFANYWLGGLFVVEGTTEVLYDQATYFASMQEKFGNGIEIRAWSYPPHTLLFLWPLGFVPYKTGLVVFLITGFVAFYFAAAAALRSLANPGYETPYAISLLPFMIVMVACMQNGLHLGALMIAGLLLMHKSPFLSGLCFAILTIKPQLGILIPFLLIFCGAWRSIFWATVLTIFLVLISIVAFGMQDWLDYFDQTIPYQTMVMHKWDGSFLRMMPGLFASLRVLEIDPGWAQIIHMVAGAVLLPVILRWMYSEADRPTKAFILLVGTFLITPYSFIYDMGAYAVIASIMFVNSLNTRNWSTFVWTCALAVPAVVFPLSAVGLPLAPVLLLVILIWTVTHPQSKISMTNS